MDSSGTTSGRVPQRSSLVAWVLFALFVAVAVILRVLHLEDFPSFIHNDESAAAIYIAPPFLGENPDSPLWGFNNYGRHANFGAWLTSLSVKWFGGQTLWAIRMGSVVCGILSIIFFALFIRLWLGFRTTLLFLVAVAPFHLHVFYSRTGFHYIQAATFIALVSYLFGRLVRTPSALNGALLGIGLGFALMVYSATLVLPAALLIGLLALFCRRDFVAACSGSRYRGVARVVACLGFGILLSMGGHLYHIAQIGFSSRLDSQSVLNKIPIEQRGGYASHLDLVWDNIQRTVLFFYESDAAGQYGYLAKPLEAYSYVAAGLGFFVIVYRSLRLDPHAIYVLVLASATIVGSALMIEGNFSPHLIAFSLLIPLACAMGVSLVCDVLRIRSILLTGILSICLLVPWTKWNYDFISSRESRRYNMDTHILHLPIDREMVKTTMNFTPFYGDLSESFYRLQYPVAKPLKVEVGDVPQQVLDLYAEQRCPCLIIVNRAVSNTLMQRLQHEERSFTHHPVPRSEADVFVIK